MKSLLLAFFITLAAQCVSLWCIQQWKLARAERRDCEAELADRSNDHDWYRNYVRFNLSKDPKLPLEEQELIVSRLGKSEEAYQEAVVGVMNDAKQREEDSRQIAASFGGVALIGILALTFRGRQLWRKNSAEPVLDQA